MYEVSTFFFLYSILLDTIDDDTAIALIAINNKSGLHRQWLA